MHRPTAVTIPAILDIVGGLVFATPAGRRVVSR
jgi:hypothetical protein